MGKQSEGVSTSGVGDEQVQEGVAAASAEQTTNADEQAEVTQLDFTAWFNTLPSEQQELVDQHIEGLKSALKAERAEKKAMERTLKELVKQAEGSELHKQLSDLTAELQVTSARAAFMEQAHAAKVNNPRLAWLAAKDSGLVDERTGECDFGKLKEQAPEVFYQKAPTTSLNAGSGAGQNGVKATDMNALIRESVFGPRRR